MGLASRHMADKKPMTRGRVYVFRGQGKKPRVSKEAFPGSGQYLEGSMRCKAGKL